MKKALLTFLVFAVGLLPLAASAQGFKDISLPDIYANRDASVIAGLMQIVNATANIQTAPAGNKVDMASTATRGGGGSSIHPHFGCYIGSPNDVEFRSDYKDLDAQTIANWAYDLHQWIDNHGYGFDNFQNYQRKGDPNAWNRSFMSHDEQRQYAELYWERYSQKFHKMPSMYRDWWLNDSILDGNNVYMEYQHRLGGKGSADFVAYKDATLAKLLKKQ